MWLAWRLNLPYEVVVLAETQKPGGVLFSIYHHFTGPAF
jgi:hypothetical protein